MQIRIFARIRYLGSYFSIIIPRTIFDLSFIIILVNDQLDAQFLFSLCLFQFSTCFEQPRAHDQENQLNQYNFLYVLLCVGDTNQMLYWYNWFSWLWAQGCSNHVENWNKRIEKGIVYQVVHLQDLYRDTRSTEHRIFRNSQFLVTHILNISYLTL
jgi:hypothetical protein